MEKRENLSGQTLLPIVSKETIGEIWSSNGKIKPDGLIVSRESGICSK